MAADLLRVLLQRRSRCDEKAQMWESSPKNSAADASHLHGLEFSSPLAHEWLRELDAVPAEETVTTALGDQLLAERGELPKHTPSAQQVELLAKVVADLRAELSKERDARDSVREALSRREEELMALQQHMGPCDDCPDPPSWLTGRHGTMNIAITGNSGVGKSLLINRLRGISHGSSYWAPVGVQETTMMPTMYEFPSDPRFRLWDLPGAGTESFPLSSYIRSMGLRHFDRVVIVSAGRFTETDVTLMNDLDQCKVPNLMVRTKVDIDIFNNKADNNTSEQHTLAELRSDYWTNGVREVFFVSLRQLERFQFRSLLAKLLPGSVSQAGCEDAAQPWADSWMLPDSNHGVFTCLQGRWQDEQRTVYVVHGPNVHCTLADGRCTTVAVSHTADQRMWWIDRWWTNSSQLINRRDGVQLAWVNQKPGDSPLVWWRLD